jgi:hypothetical protein
LQPGGPGTVYVLDDGDVFKIGHAKRLVEDRVAALQTGNPRPIHTVAQVRPAGEDIQKYLHTKFR